jgi:hypothetical protein
MESTAERTLVKSAPELWELADDVARMEAWMGRVVGSHEPVPVEVTDREPQQSLAWRARGPGDGYARIALELAERGFGTSVSITAERSGVDGAGLDTALERLLDELGSAARRPFASG